MNAVEGERCCNSSLLELFPIKLVGGFITVDDHVGCVGCRFCLSRRHALWRDVLDAGRHWDGAFDGPEQALSLLSAMRSFTEAKVPVRFGHNTDSAFQWDFGAALYGMMPSRNPFIFMTRFPVPGEHARLFQGQSNLLVKMTITPPSETLGVETDVDALLASVRSVPLSNIYVLVGPITADNVDAAASVIERLPQGAWADAKQLTTEGIPGMDAIAAPPPEEIDALQLRGTRRGLVMTDFFGCILRRQLRRPFYKKDGLAPYIEESCRRCPQRAMCRAGKDASETEGKARRAAKTIGLTLGRIERIGPHTSRFQCVEPSSRGDETYLSELLDHRILLASVPSGSEGGSFGSTERDILQRWERVGMLPSSRVEDLAKRIEEATRSEMKEHA